MDGTLEHAPAKPFSTTALVAEALDEDFYRTQLGDPLTRDLVAHYMHEGWRQGLDPRRDFSTRFYLAAYHDALVAEEDPFSHWLRTGRRKGFAPNASAMTLQSLDRGDEFDLVAGALDRGFYVRQFPSLRGTTVNAALHYMLRGWRLELDPSPSFSTRFYLSRSPDVRAAGMNPLYHYLVWGRHEGRAATPDELERTWTPTSEAEAVVAAAFDADYYFSTYPQIAATHVNPVRHYLAFGWRQGLDPCPDFSTRFYLERSPDVRAVGLNPFYHYLVWGAREGRAPSPRRIDVPPESRTFEEVLTAPMFDSAWYAASYPETARNHVDPLKHYLHFGWRLGFDPSPGFSTRYYLEQTPELRDGGQSPLTHYASVGRARGCRPSPP